MEKGIASVSTLIDPQLVPEKQYYGTVEPSPANNSASALLLHRPLEPRNHGNKPLLKDQFRRAKKLMKQHHLEMIG